MTTPPKAAKALFAASLDPITNGHLSLIEKAAALFPNGLTVLVAVNPKKASGTFPVQKRIEIAQEALAHLKNVTVTSVQGVFTADYAQRNDIGYLVRGIRSASDTDAEMRIARYNERIAPNVQTFAIPAPTVLGDISSSELKGLVGFHGWMDLAYEMAPEASVKALIKMEAKRRFDLLTEETGHEMQEPPDWEFIENAYTIYPYHNLEHILRCLEWLNVLGLAQDQELEAAIFMHDVTRHHKNDSLNVKESAEVMRREFGEMDYDTRLIAEYIMATDHSRPAPKTEKARLMHDIDLAILGANPEGYARYQKQVREEYEPNVGTGNYLGGRIAFLKKMLARKKIFLTPEFKALEKVARENMRGEYESLHGR